MRMRHEGGLLAAISVGCAMACAAPVNAQPAAISEVIVTARKRQESSLNVPVIATTLGGQQLERFQTKDLRDLTTLVPGLALGESVLSNGLQISLRGIGTTSYDPGVDQSVAMNVDGLQLSNGLAYMSGMFDTGQIEVLKGPQALFYGKSNPGGVISVRTADPTREVELIARGMYEFEARERRGELIVSGPISDTLKARLAGFYSKSDGFYKNIQDSPVTALGARQAPSRLSGQKSWMLRATLLWNPTDTFDARLKLVNAQDRIDEQAALQLVYCPEGTGPLVLGPGIALPFLNPNDECRKNRQISWVASDPAAFPLLPTDGSGLQDMVQTYGTLEMNFRPSPGLTVTSATGVYLLHAKSSFSASAASASATSLFVTNGFRRSLTTQEIRVNSDYEGPLNFTAGGFLERGRYSDLVTFYGNVRVGFPALVNKGDQAVHIKTNSLFGQLRYKITPELEVTAGARWTDEKRDIDAVTLVSGAPVTLILPTPKLHSRNVSPELTLTYKPSEDTTLFANAKRGYKSGSYNVGTPPALGGENSFDDERVTGGEVGFKSRLAERTVLFNVAAYYYKYDGLQVGAIATTEGGSPVNRTINAGAARVYGVESDVVYRVPSVDDLTLRAAVNYNNGKYTELNNVPCYGGQTIALGCNLQYSTTANGGAGGFTAQDQSGLPLVRSAKWQANFGFDWSIPVGSDMRLIIANNQQVSTKYLVNLGQEYYQKGFIKADLSLTLQGANNRWDIALIGKNLNNALTGGNCTNFNGQGGLFAQVTGSTVSGPSGLDEIGCWMDRGREVWVRVSFRPFSR